MKLLEQPTKSSCGQACIAMICDVGFWEAAHAVGHYHCTRTKEVVKALRHFGCDVEDHLTILRDALPARGTYLVKLRYPGTRSHWVVLHEGDIYDPAHGMNPEMQEGWRYTSYLKIRR